MCGIKKKIKLRIEKQNKIKNRKTNKNKKKGQGEKKVRNKNKGEKMKWSKKTVWFPLNIMRRRTDDRTIFGRK